MFKKILIASGVIVLLAMLAIWVYLLLFGTPSSLNSTFTNLGLIGTPTTERPIIEDTTQVALTSTIQPLTTRPVAGFVVLKNQISASTTELSIDSRETLRYAERGTGHIYEINLNNGEEKRLSGTTVPQTTKAFFSPDGSKVVLVAKESPSEAGILNLGATGSTVEDLPSTADNFGWSADSAILGYTTTDSGQSTYYEQEDDSITTKWSLPLTDIVVYKTNDVEIIVNKTAPQLKGGVFMYKDGILNILVEPEYGLFALPNSSGNIVDYTYYNPVDKIMQSKRLLVDDLQSVSTSMPVVPGKCQLSNSTSTPSYCAMSSEWLVNNSRDTLNLWYRGEISSPDMIRVLSEDGKSSKVVSLLSREVGFDIDVIDLTVSDNSNKIFFRNKIDDTLWMIGL